MKCAVIEVLVEKQKLVVVDYYNPCLKLELNKSEEIEGQSSASIVWCGDFRAHNSEKTDGNGQVMEDLLDERSLVVLK